MMHNYAITRTPEQGHTVRCLAAAMISAIENLRDSALDASNSHGDSDLADHDFRSSVQENVPLQWADLYLAEGMTICYCPPDETDSMSRDEERYTLAGQP